jgi:hypothetical protein
VVTETLDTERIEVTHVLDDQHAAEAEKRPGCATVPLVRRITDALAPLLS